MPYLVYYTVVSQSTIFFQIAKDPKAILLSEFAFETTTKKCDNNTEADQEEGEEVQGVDGYIYNEETRVSYRNLADPVDHTKAGKECLGIGRGKLIEITNDDELHQLTTAIRVGIGGQLMGGKEHFHKFLTIYYRNDMFK